MASNRQSTVTTVRIAFDSDPEPHHCGYCNTNGSCTAGLYNLSTINLRKVRASNCGYCLKQSGKISFGKKDSCEQRKTEICFSFYFRHCRLDYARR